MADLSKIKLNGIEYDLKDSFAREKLDNKQIKNFVLKYKFTNNASSILIFIATAEPGSSTDLPDENCENINEFFQILNTGTFNLDQSLQTRIEFYNDSENLIACLIFNLTILSTTSQLELIGSNNYGNKTYMLYLSPDSSGKLNGQISITSLENITIYNASVNDNNIISISGHTTGDIWYEISDDMDNMYVRYNAYGKYFLKLNIESEDIKLPLIGQGQDNINDNGYYAIFSGTRNDKIYTARIYQNNNFGELVINETPSSAQITYWNQKSDFSGSYNDLTNKPTSVSEFVNDVGYLTSYTETDPTVPAWAKQTNKPTYTASEVGALPSTYTAPVTSVNGQTGAVNLTIPAAQVQSDWNAISGMGVILNKPNVSTFMVKGTDYVTAGQKSGTTLGNKATAEGGDTTASGNYSHAEGGVTTASGNFSHAEGYNTTASGNYSHAEGYNTTASENFSHAEGINTTASGGSSHAEGYNTVAGGYHSHAEGNYTTAQRKSQHVFGEYNILDTTGTTTTRGQYVEIVGNGTSSARSNARTLDWSGNEVLAGKLTIGTAPTANMDVTTKQYVDNAITTAIGGINQFEVAIVTDLPTTDIDAHTIYFKSNSSSGNNVYDEYMYINSNWELIGSTQVDLSNYLQKTDIASWAKQSTKPAYTASEVGALPDTTTIPTKTSDLTNDSGYITSYTETDPVFTASAAAGISSTDISNWNAKSDFSGSYNDLEDKPTIPNVPAWALAENKPTYTANEVGALPNTTVIPTVPTDVSAFNNDAGYITSYTETDPTVPAWAKAANKPTYTAAEVGALPDTTVIPAAQVNADWDATSGVAQILHKPTIPTVPTNVSAFTNDSGYLTSYTETDPTVPAWAKAESKPTYTAQEVGALPDDTVIPTVPTNVSAFTNDAGYLTSYTETDPTVPAWAKASAKPTYTASEVGAAASSHVHGNVKNDGTITVNTSMANGDRLLFSDTSDSSKIKNSNITIGTSTTQYLANNGTWQNLPTVSVSQTLTSGTEIGSVNNTKLYAPAPYNDSALAARVTALEQLEWATYYSGRSNPSNSQGQNGDIYLQY